MGDFRAELAALVAAYDEHRKWTLNAVFEGLHQAVERARAALTQPGAKESTVLARVEFAEREFNFPSDVVLRQYCDDWFYSDPERSEVDPVDLCRGAIKLFAQAPTPIPVTERLPGPEDCDAEGRCWWGDAGDDQFVPSWRLCEQPDDTHFTHWLPAHALPLPEEKQ